MPRNLNQKCIKHVKNYIYKYMRNIRFWIDIASFLYKNNSLYVLKLTEKDDNLKQKTTALILDEK